MSEMSPLPQAAVCPKCDNDGYYVDAWGDPGVCGCAAGKAREGRPVSGAEWLKGWLKGTPHR
jgi:hypothetical protein